jgi:hypothetical protein
LRIIRTSPSRFTVDLRSVPFVSPKALSMSPLMYMNPYLLTLLSAGNTGYSGLVPFFALAFSVFAVSVFFRGIIGQLAVVFWVWSDFFHRVFHCLAYCRLSVTKCCRSRVVAWSVWLVDTKPFQLMRAFAPFLDEGFG